MPYDKLSFLSGVAAGRNMESWPAFEGAGKGITSFTIDTRLGSDITTYQFWIKRASYPYTDILIYWGDGTTSSAVNNLNSHEYQTPGMYTIVLFGYYEEINFSASKTGTDESNSLLAIHTPFSIAPIHNTYIVNLYTLFSGCRNLKTIPNRLLAEYYENGYKFSGLQYAFTNCKALHQIPEDLFDGIEFAGSDPEFSQVFNGSGLEEIPSRLLASPEFSKVKRAYMPFAGLNITKIPAGLFNQFSNCKSFESVFQGCSFLETIPGGLFDSCVAVQSFRFSFLRCESLQSLPSGLFSENEDVTDFTGTFQECASLELVPLDTFNLLMNTTPIFSSCFRNDRKITSAVPDLWNYYPDSAHVGCFLNCSRAANYADIPSDWK